MALGRRLGGLLAAWVVAACSALPSATAPGTIRPSDIPSLAAPGPTVTAAPSTSTVIDSGLVGGWTGHVDPQFAGLQSAVLSRQGDREIVIAMTTSGGVIVTTRDGATWTPATGLGLVASAVGKGDGGIVVGSAVVDKASLPNARLASQRSTARLAYTMCGSEPPLRAAVWTSADGSAWREVPRQASMAHVPMLAISPAPGGAGYVAVGRQSHCSSSDGLTHSAAWYSNDGIAWTLTGSSVFGNAAVLDVDGETAVGSDRFDDEFPGYAHPAIWRRSAQGAWQRVNAALGWGVPTLVASVGPIVLAVGSTGPSGGGDIVPVAWIRDEAGSWTGPHPLSGFISSMVVVDDANGPWLLAAMGGQAVATRDGRTWVQLTPSGEAVRAVGTWSGGAIAVGTQNDQDPAAPGIVWIGPRSWPGP